MMNQMVSKGFSLVELMVVVAIVGILAVVAVPSYNSHTIKASRAAAQTDLIKLAALQEKIYLNSNAYTCGIPGGYTATSTGGLGVANSLSTDSKYTLDLNTCTANAYILTATPVEGSRQVGDGAITIQENGQRRWFQGIDAPTNASSSVAW